jgi:hypothetical protein
VIGNPGGHGWRRAEREVLALEIVNHHEDGDLRFVIINFLAEPVG